MDYKIVGIYNEKKESTFDGSFLHPHEGKKYEIVEFPIHKRYTIEGNSVVVNDIVFPLHRGFQKIVPTDTFLFICYKKTLEIFNLEGDLLKEIISKEPITIGSHGFMLFNRMHYILNLDAQSVFIHKHDDVLNFTGEGKIFATEFSKKIVCMESGIENLIMDVKPSDIRRLTDNLGTKELVQNQKSEDIKISTAIDLGDNSVADYMASPNSERSQVDFTENTMSADVKSRCGANEEKCFVIQDLNSKIVYDADGEIILSFHDCRVLKNTAKISNVTTCTSIKLQVFSASSSNDNKDCGSNYVFSDCIVVLCTDSVFVILDDIVVKRPLKERFAHILPERFVVHNYVNECSIYDCLLLINCIRPVFLFKTGEIEGFLAALMNINANQNIRFAENFIKGLKLNSKTLAEQHKDHQTILCRVYRQVDDDSKKLLDSHIDFKTLNADQMFYIVIYKPELMKNFIHLCKLQKRLFYLEDLRDFYAKTGRVDECKRLFLENGVLMFKYNGVEKFYEIEKQQIESQRLEFITFNAL